jgi:flagella basal body P-ring formation protein FlgA
MLFKLSLLFLLAFNLYAQNILKKEYYIKEQNIMLSTIVPHPKDDLILYSITEGRYTKRVKSRELLSRLKSLGYDKFSSKSSYIKFIKESPIDMSFIKKGLKEIYMSRYKYIDIKSIEIHSRGYIENLPKEFTLHLQSKSHLSKSGTLFIKSKEKRELFFSYSIDAKVVVYKTRKAIKRGEELSNLNIKKESIILNKFRAMPIQEIEKDSFESKHHLKKDKLLTTRDIERLTLVKRGESISVKLSQNGISILFSAKALQSGIYGDTIEVKKSKSKVLKVKVIGRNRGEVL